MAKPPTLDESIRTAVYDLFGQAKESLQALDYSLAEQRCMEAWQIIPEPRYGWDSSYVCTSHAVSLLRGAQRYDSAMSLVQGYLLSGYHLDYDDGPYFWRGTLHYEMGDLSEAFSDFDLANKMSGGRCFKEEDPRYKAFYTGLKTKGRSN